MKFQSPSMHGSEVMLCIKKACNVKKKKSPKLPRAISLEVFYRIYSKINQIIYSSIPVYSPGFKALASIFV